MCIRDRYGARLTFNPNENARDVQPLDHLAVVATAQFGEYTLKEYENGSVVAFVSEAQAPVTAPILRKIAAEIGCDMLWANGRPKNTRHLGAAVIAMIAAKAGGV